MTSPTSGAPPARSDATVACPKCGAPTSGRFCAECGTAVTGARCAGCRTELTPGAKFCHRCGLPSGAERPASGAMGQNTALPWAIAGIASLAFVAFVIGQRINKPAAATDDAAAAAPFAGGAAGGGVAPAGSPLAGMRAPDISNMTPEEKRIRLFNRVMTYSENGMADSLALWAPMAINAYENLGPLDLEGEYELGRLAEVSEDADLTKSQADLILKEAPNHLLGLALAAHAATMRKDASAEREFFKRFLAAEATERTKDRPEYKSHAPDVTQAEQDARRVIPPTSHSP